MEYSQLIKITFEAQEIKPSFGSPCNNCGWCCMTEVCAGGVKLGADPQQLPCKFLIEKDGKHLCSIHDQKPIKVMIGKGCDAMTSNEMFELMK